jgi:hypothetical protein
VAESGSLIRAGDPLLPPSRSKNTNKVKNLKKVSTVFHKNHSEKFLPCLAVSIISYCLKKKYLLTLLPLSGKKAAISKSDKHVGGVYSEVRLPIKSDSFPKAC